MGEEKGTINPTQLKVLRKWEAQMNSESLGVVQSS